MLLKRKIKSTLITLSLFFLTTTVSYVHASESVEDLIAGYSSNRMPEMIVSPINYETWMAMGALSNLPQGMGEVLTTGQLKQLLTPQLDDSSIALSYTWQPSSLCPDNSLCSKNQATLLNTPISSINLNSLLQPLIYNSPAEEQAALNFISFNSGILAPLQPLNLVQLTAGMKGDPKTNLANKLKEPQTLAYLNQLRIYAAGQSVALSNLYDLFSEREPLNMSSLTPKDRENLQQKLGKTASPLLIENYMATHRLSDSDWQAHLIGENPATLQREMIVLMAENLAESYKTRLTLERLLATVSYNLLVQNNMAAKTQVQAQIDKLTNSSNSKGGSPPSP